VLIKRIGQLERLLATGAMEGERGLVDCQDDGDADRIAIDGVVHGHGTPGLDVAHSGKKVIEDLREEMSLQTLKLAEGC